jgi:DNA polymerase-3 subunit beta
VESVTIASYGIGRFARVTGLTVSALRFYDRVGVLAPAVVDPSTGYRWYTEDQVRPARLVAALRRVGLPIADITLVLRLGADRPAVRRVLDRHVRRLEDGLTDAKRELSRALTLLGPQEFAVPAVVTVPAARLAHALDAVRFAVSVDPSLPGLGGARFDLADGVLRLVATDRYRLAVAGVPAPAGEPFCVTAPAGLLDAARGILDGADIATVTLDAARISVRAGEREVDAVPLEHDFPDYRRLLRETSAHRHVLDAAALRGALTTGPVLPMTYGDATTEVSVLSVDADGTLRVGAAEPEPDALLRVAFNREYLLQAIDAGRTGQLVLELDGPVAPLAVRWTGDAETYSILMPTRLG